MHIEHVAIWTHDLERLRSFYETYFAGQASAKYVNARKQFESYFLTFAAGARLELMQMPTVPLSQNDVAQQFTGYIHIAFSVGSREAVEALTDRLRTDGYPILDGPRTTGDGYYESSVLDPDRNRIEITI
ncbi:lactoylglutathione lyase [Thermoflexales bacterium]|nr:lactoylglutathione lyase [Thermoflexales bacterium]